MSSIPKLSEEERKQRRRESALKYYYSKRSDPEFKRKKTACTSKCLNRNIASGKKPPQWSASNPEKAKSNRLLTKYGITLKEWEALFESQESKCAVCGSPDPSTKSGWHTDHCHETGRVRGILCMPCNIMLGMSRDNTDILANAIKYLN